MSFWSGGPKGYIRYFRLYGFTGGSVIPRSPLFWSIVSESLIPDFSQSTGLAPANAAVIVFIIGTALGMLTARTIMKENALVDGLFNALTSIPPIAYPLYLWGPGQRC